LRTNSLEILNLVVRWNHENKKAYQAIANSSPLGVYYSLPYRSSPAISHTHPDANYGYSSRKSYCRWNTACSWLGAGSLEFNYFPINPYYYLSSRNIFKIGDMGTLSFQPKSNVCESNYYLCWGGGSFSSNLAAPFTIFNTNLSSINCNSF